MTQLQKAMEIDPDYSEPQSNFGIALLQEKKLDEAIPHLQRSLELNPTYAKVYEAIVSSLDWPPTRPSAGLRLEDVVRPKAEEGTTENASRQKRESLDAQYRKKLDAVLAYIMASDDPNRPAVREEERPNQSNRWEPKGVLRAPSASLDSTHSGDDRPEIESLIADLDIPRLRKLAEQEDKNSDESFAAQRQILRIFLHTFEASNTLLGQNRNAQALACLEIAAQAAPRNPYILYDLARAQALNGQQKKALTTLRAAFEKGFNRADWVEGDRAFERLRSQTDFQKALAKMRESQSSVVSRQ
jgi:tetratricopeptide (TPR) repeat protein